MEGEASLHSSLTHVGRQCPVHRLPRPAWCSPSSLRLATLMILVFVRRVRGGREMPSTGEAKHSAEFLTVAEVADRLRVTERFIRRLIASGELEAVKIGSRVIRIRSAEMDALLSPVHRARKGATTSQPARQEASRPALGLGVRVMRRSG